MCASAQAPAAPAAWPDGSVDTWIGFTRHHFTVAGCSAWIVEPRAALPGKPWSWCMEFPDAFTDRCAAPALLTRGFHHGHISVGNTFGSPAAMKRLSAFYEIVTGRGLASKPALIGLSRGGLYAYRWAAENPSKVSVIYGDAPVCDFKSWPGGKGKGQGSKGDWDELLHCYGFANEGAALAYKRNPIDTLRPLARAGVALIHVVGDADDVVPANENTRIVEERYRKLGGTIRVIHKPGVGHHPHGLDGPSPVVRFIVEHAAPLARLVVPPAKDTARLGAGIQRTMALLATSTPQRRNRVRILFYGQSITEQEWSRMVADDLRVRFPNADIEIENRAIGGFASQMLIMPAEHDMYPYYPDLVIFHVYGANGEYEEIIKSIRSRTTAEVLMQRDHVTAWPDPKADETKDKGLWWDNRMNNVHLPEIARKYCCGLADVRGGWLDTLKANHLEPKAPLSDDVHLNDQGCDVMARLINRELVYRPGLSSPPLNGDVRTVVVGKDVRWSGGRLTLQFDGNRIDALSGWSGPGDAAECTVLIDGKKPSEFPEAYCITRPAPGPWSPLFIARIDHDTPLVVEDWTLKITSVSDDGKQWTFDVQGSVTGADGSGDNTHEFVSKSGRVRISPKAHFNSYGGSKPSVGYECTWKALPMHSDRVRTPIVTDPAGEFPITLVQGIRNGRHTLEIVSDNGKPAPIRALRVYRPPVR